MGKSHLIDQNYSLQGSQLGKNADEFFLQASSIVFY